MESRTGRIVTNDGVEIAYEEQGSGRPLVLVHGWPFSRRFFFRNLPALAEHARVIAVDLRGHGDSESPGHGYRIARLAKDLDDLLTALDLHAATLLGWSLGCSVIWSHIELFGTARLAQAVFVDQSPRAYAATDWAYPNSGASDDASLAAMLARMSARPDAFDAEQLDAILRVPLPEGDRRMLLAETAKAGMEARAGIMTDHARADWRDLLPTIDLATLVLVARQDPQVDWHGPAWVGEAIPGARIEFFEESSHALFLDEPDHFARVVVDFLTEIP